MPRMIDADVLLSQVKRSREKNPYTWAMLGSLNAVYDFTHRDVLNLINSASTIDAEPVRHMGKTTNIDTDNLDVFGGRIIVTQGKFCRVYYEDESIIHCKDCKHWGTGYGGETEHIKVCEYANYMVGENGYCVYGERKMDEEVQ